MIFKALDTNAVVIDGYQPPPDATPAALKNYKHIERNSLLLLLSYCKRHGGRAKGHNWQDCRTLKRDQIKKKKNADAQIAEAQSSFAYAEGFITEVSSQLQNDGIHSWKFDTCATSHMTSDIGKFHTITP